MFFRLLFLFTFICSSFLINAQLNLSLVGQHSYTGHGDVSDIWGYVDGTGKEYAIVGLEDGTSIVDISIPSNPVEVFFSNGVSTIWRDIKTWNQHAYIVNEGGNGVKIIDLSNLPGPITAGDVSQYTGSTYPFTSAHDIYIDENGYAYILGANNGVGGAIILNLNNDPKNPIEVGRYNDYYIHDAMVRGDTMWAGCVNDGFFAVIDVSNKSNPTTMATQNTPNFTSHNCWISDDGQTLFTTDEVSNGFIGVYDVSNLSNISELDRVQSSPGQNVIPHNAFYHNGFIVTSYYRDGVVIFDANQPNNMIEIGNYDTSPAFTGNGFNGNWGVYPYLPSGLIIASDIENGLFILSPTYTPACYLDGKVTDTLSGNPIDNVQVNIVSTNISANTNLIGNYQTGIANSGNYSISFSKFGYQSKTINNVSLTNGNTTTLNAELVPISFTLQGQVIDAASSNPIPNAFVRITNDSTFNTTVQTDASGNFTVPGVEAGNLNVYIGKWGHHSLCLTNQNLNPTGNPYIYQLNKGYSDDFMFDLGWSVAGNAQTGDWVKGEPNGTSYFGTPSNPDNDVLTDCSDEAYVTGNAGGGVGDDDIDGGQTILTSPIFDLSTYIDPYIHFQRWFFNAGSGTPNDSLVVELLNGSTTAIIDVALENDIEAGTWSLKTVKVFDFITPTSTMQLRVRAMDLSPGHISEGGFDDFLVVDSAATSINLPLISENIVTIFPNPFNDKINIVMNEKFSLVQVQIFDVLGKLIDAKKFMNTNNLTIETNYDSGVYFVKIIGDDKIIETKKMIKLIEN